MAGIDTELRMREMAAGTPQAAQQKYAQSQNLLDLLVAQKVSNDYASARNAIQAATQAPAGTVKDQLDMANEQVTRNDMMRSIMPGVQMKAARDSQAMQRRNMGVPSQPAPNIRMRDGGIVGYEDGGVVKFNNRGVVSALDAALEAEGITDPVAVELIRSIYGQESSSGSNVKVSPAGARGPMQVMPATFEAMMGSDADINDPMTNLRAGARYAQRMLQKAGGDPRLAAAAYYGGPDEIAKQRAGINTQAKDEGFPSVSEYADQVAARVDGGAPTGRLGDYTGDLEAAGIDPDLYASTFREDAGKGTQSEITKDQTEDAIDRAYFERTGQRRGRSIFRPAIDAVSSFLDTMTRPPEYIINEAGFRVPNPSVRRSGEEVAETIGDYNARLAEIKEEIPGLSLSDRAVLAGQELSTEAKRSRAGTPLGDRVPSRDAGKVADPFNVKDMVGRLGAPEFRMQGIMRDAEPTDRQRFAKAFGLPLKDFEKKAPPPEKKGIFDNVDIGRLQAFLAGGAGQTSTAGALGGGLRGLMGEDQRREALASKEAIEAAKIASQRYGIEQDYNAALAKLGFDKQKMVFDAQSDMLKERFKADSNAAAEAMGRIENNSEYQKEFMRLSAEYGDNPARLGAELAAVATRIADADVGIQRLLRDGEGAGAFEVELPAGD